MQKSNLILFIVLTIAILVGWHFLQQQLVGPVQKTAKTHKEETPAQKRGEAVARMVALPPGSVPGLAKLFCLAGELAGVEKGLFPSALESAAASFTPTTLRVSGPVSLAALATAFPPVIGAPLLAVYKFSPPPEQESSGANPLKLVTLGGPDYHLEAVLTSRGAGVQHLILTRFQAADREGRPVYVTDNDGQRQPAPLELIQKDPVNPSFTLYHFPKPAKADEVPPAATLGQAIWKLEPQKNNGEEQTVSFSIAVPGYDHLRIFKTYSLKPKDYHIGLKIEVRDERKGEGPPQTFRYQLAGPHGIPIEGVWYTYTYRNAILGTLEGSDDLYRTLEDSRRISNEEGGPRVPEDPNSKALLQYAVVANQYFAAGIVVDDHQQEGVNPRDILAWARATLETREIGGKVIRLDLKRGNVSVLPTTGLPESCHLLPRAIKQFRDLDLNVGDEVLITVYDVAGEPYAGDVYQGKSSRPFLNDITVRVNSEVIELKPGESRVHKFLLYSGPVKAALLSQYSGESEVPAELVTRYTDTLHLNTLTDYHSAGPFGWFASHTGLTTLFIFCTKVMHWLLYWLLLLVRNEGLAIILLTVLVRGMMFPISRKQALMSQKMQALAPEMKKVQAKYKDDPQGRTQAMMKLYRDHGVNPLGGCLPLFLQMPIFLGLYWALQESIRFRLAPFLWIENLSAPDMLIPWGHWIPWVSDPNNLGGFLYLGPYLNILPVLAVTVMLMQQKLMMPPAADDQQLMQQKMMKWMMVLMGLFFYKVAAGLCLYFIASSMWGLAERKLLPKRQTGGAAPGSGPGDGRGGGGGKGGGPSGRAKARGKKPAEEVRFRKVRDWWQELLKQAKKK
jgi:YidC/Oxa1 family membrane protein insertase